MDEQEKVMAREFAAAWIRFVNGVEPWRNEIGRKWKVWGPDSRMEVKSEAEDEEVRGYARMERVLRLGNGKVWMKWVAAVDALVNKRKLSG
jgi:hypothetical protein